MTDILETLKNLISPLLEGTDLFVINLKIKPVNNIKLFLDADSGLTIDKSARINRQLYRRIEEAGLFPDGDFSLEVSSPGVDEPLTQLRQYQKNTGRLLLITRHDGTEETGVLKTAAETHVVLAVKLPPKHTEPQEVVIPTADIKQAVVQIVF
jgi:ribosome maturation factor RimP